MTAHTYLALSVWSKLFKAFFFYPLTLIELSSCLLSYMAFIFALLLLIVSFEFRQGECTLHDTYSKAYIMDFKPYKASAASLLITFIKEL